MNEAALSWVVAMCPDRATRRKLGFSIDRCVKWGILPLRVNCPAPVLKVVSQKRERQVNVHYADAHTLVSIEFSSRDLHFRMLVGNLVSDSSPRWSRVDINGDQMFRATYWYTDPSIPAVSFSKYYNNVKFYCFKTVFRYVNE